ncbi:Na+/H+ antiporter [Leifsonia sp. F6_8S_P_1B]|uniref:Na+/H+ antiporter n=1 Tax=Leifsonia williamsii TaxID=3035919 RepID=A0ABT8KCX1_9MICO|nr:Na+/H+ antiporter [Leifsonia williamsii]MDN4614611.1 Na+/H+ antiporter [Leifsonia williamsii]
MLGLELVVAIGLATLLTKIVARKTGIAQPLLLVAIGALIGLIPAFRDVALAPEVVLFLFLPALLYWESLTTSLREIRHNIRNIILNATGLVFLTAGAVAVLAHSLGMPWGPAWVLGAAVAPTDATAVTSLTRALPRRNVTILKAESLVNDGTALVLWSLAVGFTVGETEVHAGTITVAFLLAVLGGGAAGGLVAWLSILARKRLRDALTQNLAMLLTPFAAYLIAEAIHASGVLAVVVAGLILSQAGPRIGLAEARRQTDAFWSLATFLLNASLFVLVGTEFPIAVRSLVSTDLWMALGAVFAVSALIVAVRFAWLFGTAYFLRLVDRRPIQRERRLTNRARVVSGFSGFRGAVSLAAALAVPASVGSGQPFPHRDLIVFVVTGVIVVTLAVQGLILPALVRWAKLEPDPSEDEERRLGEEKALEAALDSLPSLAAEIGVDDEIAERVRAEYEEHRQLLEAEEDEHEGETTLERDRQATELRLAMLERKRQAVLDLRDEGRIDDIVLRDLQRRIDVEEVRLSGAEPGGV